MDQWDLIAGALTDWSGAFDAGMSRRSFILGAATGALAPKVGGLMSRQSQRLMNENRRVRPPPPKKEFRIREASNVGKSVKDADLGQWRKPAIGMSKARPSLSGAAREIPGLRAAAEQAQRGSFGTGKSHLGLKPAFQPYWGKSGRTSKDAAALSSASYPKRTLGNRIGKAVRSATGRPNYSPLEAAAIAHKAADRRAEAHQAVNAGGSFLHAQARAWC